MIRYEKGMSVHVRHHIPTGPNGSVLLCEDLAKWAGFRSVKSATVDVGCSWPGYSKRQRLRDDVSAIVRGGIFELWLRVGH